MEKVKEKNAEWYQANKEKRKIKDAAYYQANKEIKKAKRSTRMENKI